MSKVEGGGGPFEPPPPPSRLRVTIFSRRLLGLSVVMGLVEYLVMSRIFSLCISIRVIFLI